MKAALTLLAAAFVAPVLLGALMFGLGAALAAGIRWLWEVLK